MYMAKDFRKASQLPEDFLYFDFAEEAAQMVDGAEELFGYDEYVRLHNLIEGAGFGLDTNMVGIREALAKEAMKCLEEKGEDLSGITVGFEDTQWVSYYKDGVEFARGYGMITVNDKYMEWDTDEPYPMIPRGDGYEHLGCSWIDNGDPTWEDFEAVEKALEQNKQ